MLAAIGRILGSCAAAAAIAAGAVKAETVRLSTLEWPPYVGQGLPGGGATTEVVRAAFAEAGYTIELAFRPWKRAIDMADKGTDEVVAYFPAYHCTHLDGFLASEPIGSGPLGFAEHSEAPFAWETLDDIAEQGLRIGTVLGYANTDAFDAKVSAGEILATQSADDLTNLRKLQRRRIDAVVIDKFVLEYMKLTEPSLKAGGDQLRFNANALEEKLLYVCFRPDPELQEVASAFNAGLAHVAIDSIVAQYFETAFPD